MMKIWKGVKLVIGGTIFGYFLFAMGAGFGQQATAEYAQGSDTMPEISLNPISWLVYAIWAFNKGQLG